MLLNYKTIIQPLFKNSDYELDVLRLDLLHPEISGNKWFKLKYNLEEAKKQGNKKVLTFGGAFSNHIAATAAACKAEGLQSIGIIRGEFLAEKNHTLSKAKNEGMVLKFVDRSTYTKKNNVQYVKDLETEFGDFYLLPEGGDNNLGIKGCTEIISKDTNYDVILCASGTGTTFAGIYLALRPTQLIVGISVLKGENLLPKVVEEKLKLLEVNKRISVLGNQILNKEILTQSGIINTFAFSGYAKYNEELIKFKKEFELRHNIPLDYIYTNKLLYAAFQLMEQKKFSKNSKILVVHSGGLQGNEGFEATYQAQLRR